MAKTLTVLGNTEVLACKRMVLIILLIQMVYFSVQSLYIDCAASCIV